MSDNYILELTHHCFPGPRGGPLHIGADTPLLPWFQGWTITYWGGHTTASLVPGVDHYILGGTHHCFPGPSGGPLHIGVDTPLLPWSQGWTITYWGGHATASVVPGVDHYILGEHQLKGVQVFV